MARSMDALQCFSHLNDQVPSWITRVTDLATHTAAKHAEFTADYDKLIRVKPAKPLKHKSSSLRSLRPEERQPAADRSNEETELQEREQSSPFNATNRYTQFATRRRRGGDSAGSKRNGDGQMVVRERHHVVIHYDGHTQSELEQLVREIGTARNNIRKGKMSQMMKSGFGLGSYGSRSRLRASKDDLKSGLALDGRAMTRPRPPKETPFDFADKQLEVAQSLCESAAHVFLRDGDCSMELNGAQGKFDTILEMAQIQVERLEAEQEEQKEASQAKEDRRRERERAKAEAEADAGAEAKCQPTAVAAVPTDSKPALPSSMAIEVDDASSTASSISIDIAAFRSTRFRA